MANVQIWSWDQISGEWISAAIDVSPSDKAKDINYAASKALEVEEWDVEDEKKLRGARVIELSSGSGNFGIIVVGASDQEDAERIAEEAGYGSKINEQLKNKNMEFKKLPLLENIKIRVDENSGELDNGYAAIKKNLEGMKSSGILGTLNASMLGAMLSKKGIKQDADTVTKLEGYLKGQGLKISGRVYEGLKRIYEEDGKIDAVVGKFRYHGDMAGMLADMNSKTLAGMMTGQGLRVDAETAGKLEQRLAGNGINISGTVYEGLLYEKEYSEEERKKLAGKGEALPDGSFPIADKKDLHNAISAYGRAGDKEAAMAHIKKRVKELGAESEVSAEWGGTKE